MQFIEYKVYPLSYCDRVISSASLHFDCDRNYFFQIQWEIPEEKEDEEYRYRISLICYILRTHGGLGDDTIMHFMNFKRPSELSYYFGIIDCMKPFDSDINADLSSILFISDNLNVKTVKVPILYIPPIDNSQLSLFS